MSTTNVKSKTEVLEGTLEYFLCQLKNKDILYLFEEAEQFRKTGILPLDAFSREVSLKVFKDSYALNLLKVHNEVYRQLALQGLARGHS